MRISKSSILFMFLVMFTSVVGLSTVTHAETLAFKVGKVVTFDDQERVINNATVIVIDGKITAIGKSKEIMIPAGAKVIEHKDLWLVPGMVECHNHTGGGSSDLHDYVYLTNPGLRTLESLVPDNPEMVRARAGGVTTILTIPGSGNNMSGFGTILKTAGGSVEESVLKAPGSLKIAQAGNPERYFYGVGRSFMNFNTRQTLRKAKDYHLARTEWEEGKLAVEPAFNLNWEEFRPLFRRETVASVHTQIYQVLMTTVKMVAGEFNIRTVLDHSTFDAWKVAPLVNENDSLYTINGPRQLHYDRTQRRLMGNAARWWQGGVRKLGINTDSPVVPQEELFYQASMACYYGWKPYEALKGITRIPAEALMMDHRLGSITVGLDADFCLWTGDPIDPRSSCEMTVIDGEVTYEASEKRVF